MANSKKSTLFHFEPRTFRQKQAYDLFPEVDLLFLLGPAGTGKTTVAMACALADILSTHTSSPRKKIVLVRPAIVLAGEDMGFIPGEVSEKLEPFLAPFKSALSKLIWKPPEDLLQYEALAYVRGVTWENSVILVDEAQNLNFHKLKAVLSRMGKGSKMIVMGDSQQSDIRSRNPDFDCDLEELVDRLETAAIFQDVAVVDFQLSDCQRHSLVGRILGILVD